MQIKLERVIAALIIAAAAAACASAAHPEQATLDEFFTQSKLYDKAALAHIATVVFDPAKDGIVERFTVTNVVDDGPERKTVTVDAHVKVPGSDAPVEKTVLLTLAKGRKDDPAASARWIVTGFIERAGKPAIPRS